MKQVNLDRIAPGIQSSSRVSTDWGCRVIVRVINTAAELVEASCPFFLFSSPHSRIIFDFTLPT